MIRKIIKQGHNTLTVTLPSEWAKRFNLRSGENITVIERENGLFVTTERINKPSEIEIDITDLSIPLIWKYISTAYRAGYDKVTIKFPPNSSFESPYKYFAHYIKDPLFISKEKLSPQEFIEEICGRFVGFEVIDYGSNFCILKEIGQSTSKEFDNSLRRIFLLLLHLSEGIIGDLQKGKNNFLDKAHNVDIQIDKFHDFCARVLNKTGFEEPSKSSLIFTLIYSLELVGDEFKHLAVQLRNKNPKKINSKKVIILLNSINEQLKIFYELYYKYDKQKLRELFKSNSEFTHKEDKKINDYKQDIQVTIESINRYIYILSEILIAKQVSSSASV
jgi:phosphate uptake regulator